VNKRRLSVIIPTLNEEKSIGETMARVAGHEGVEVIVVDGGSSDNTVMKARELADKAISAPRGRASQMNAGAREVGGEILFFLHADCVPPEDFHGLITEAIDRPGTIAGAFDIRIGHSGVSYRLIEKMANLRSRLTGVPYGDQGLFMSCSTFELLGGFKDIPLMEDIEVSGRLKGMGSIGFLSSPMLVSPRRWLREGIVRTTLRDWALALAYSVLKVPPEKLAGHYRDAR
jgi:rSAM/selenodomain-associated transferase 2